MTSIRELKAQTQQMRAILQLGKKGVTDSFISELNTALKAREVVKIKILNNYDGDVKETAEELSKATGAQIVNVIGGSIVFYKAKKHL